MPTINVLSKNKKRITLFHRKFTTFTAVKYRIILHGHVCLMCYRDACFFPLHSLAFAYTVMITAAKLNQILLHFFFISDVNRDFLYIDFFSFRVVTTFHNVYG